MISNKLLFLVIILSLLTPVSVLAKVENLDNQSVEVQVNKSALDKDSSSSKRKIVLSGKRDLGAFFTIGLIINFIMMLWFAIWAVGQFRQHKKHNK